MLQGPELGAAIKSALDIKSAKPGAPKYGPTALARALGIAQPSASQLLRTGRLAKDKLPALLAFFENEVGPDHFGLPYSKFEADFIKALRELPPAAQRQLLEKVQDAAKRIAEAVAPIDLDPTAQHRLGGSSTNTAERSLPGTLAA